MSSFTSVSISPCVESEIGLYVIFKILGLKIAILTEHHGSSTNDRVLHDMTKLNQYGNNVSYKYMVFCGDLVGSFICFYYKLITHRISGFNISLE